MITSMKAVECFVIKVELSVLRYKWEVYDCVVIGMYVVEYLNTKKKHICSECN